MHKRGEEYKEMKNCIPLVKKRKGNGIVYDGGRKYTKQ